MVQGIGSAVGSAIVFLIVFCIIIGFLIGGGCILLVGKCSQYTVKIEKTTTTTVINK